MAHNKQSSVTKTIPPKEEEAPPAEELGRTLSFTPQVAPEPMHFTAPAKPVDTITEPMVNSQLDEVLTSLGSTNEQSALLEDQSTQETARNEQIMAAATGEGEPQQRLQNVQALMDEPREDRSLGTIYVENNFQDADATFRENMAEEIDIALKSSENQEMIARIIDDSMEQNYERFTLDPRAWVLGLASELAPEGSKFKELTKFLVGEGGFGDKSINDGLLETLSAQVGDLSFPGQKFETVADFADFVGAQPVDESVAVDWMGIVKHFLDGEGLRTIDPKFGEQMQARYGDEWKMKFASFGLKEVGVDAAILISMALSPKIAAAAFPGKGAKLAQKFKATFLRAGAVGLGGGSVQAGMNMIAERDPEFVEEFVLRFLGELGGETLVGTVKAGVRGVRGTGKSVRAALATKTETFAARNGLPVAKPDVVAQAIDHKAPKSNLLSVVARASLYGYTQEYMRLANKVAKGMITPEMKQVREQISKMTGIADDRLETELALGDQIWNLEEFINVGRSPDLNKAKRTLDRAGTAASQAEAEKLALEKVRTQVLARFNKSTAKTEKGRVGRLQRIFQMNREMSSIEQRLAKARNTQDEALTAIQALDSAPTTSGSSIADRVATSQAFGFQIMGRSAARQSQVQDLFMTFLNDGGEFQFRPFGGNHRGKRTPLTVRAKRMIRLEEPGEFAAYAGVQADFADAVEMSNRYGKVFSRMQDVALKGLNKNEKNRVFDVLQEGSDAERVFNVDDLMARGFNDKEIDSYRAIRQTLDLSHTIMDRALVQEFQRRGVRSFKGLPVNVITSPDGVKLSGSQVKSGFVRIVEVRDSGARRPLDTVVHKGDLTDLQTVLPSHTGYVPVAYKNPRYHVTKLDLQNNTVERVAAVARATDAIKKSRQLQVDEQNPKVMYVYSEWDNNAGIGSSGISGRNLDMLETVGQEGLDQIKAKLREFGVNQDQIRITLDNLDLTSMRRNFVGARGADRLQGVTGPAAVKPAPQATAEYLQAVARRAGLSSWRQHAIGQFEKNYKNVIDSTRHWADPSAVLEEGAVNPALRAKIPEAKAYQRWLRRAITQRTQMERKIDNWMAGKRTKMAQGTFAQRQASKVMDTMMPSLTAVIGTARGTVAFSKLMAANVAQIFVQGSQIAVTVGANPAHAIAATQDLGRLLAARGMNLVGQTPSGEGARLLAVLRKSGYLADLDTSDVTGFLKHQKSGVTHKALDIAGAISKSPFRIGEASNRLMAFLTARRSLMDRAASGTLNGLDGKPFAGAIDDDQFIRLVSERARVTALNMGRAGQLEAFSGLGSVVFQFKQVQPKALNVFETNKLTTREKYSAGAALIGLWGPTGVVLLPDLMEFTDWAIYKASGNKPTKREFFIDGAREFAGDAADYIADMTPQDMLDSGFGAEFTNLLFKRGGVRALTSLLDEDSPAIIRGFRNLDITNRVALGRFLSETVESAEPGDMIPAIAVAIDIFDASRKMGVPAITNIPVFVELLGTLLAERTGDAAPGAYKEVWAELMGDATLSEAFIFAGTEVGQVISSVGSVTRFIDNAFREESDPTFRSTDPAEASPYKTATGTPKAVVLERSELVQLLFGITPGRVVDQFNLGRVQRKYTAATQAWRKSQIQKFRDQITPSGRREVVEDTLQELQDAQEMGFRLDIDLGLSANTQKSIISMFQKELMRQTVPGIISPTLR